MHDSRGAGLKVGDRVLIEAQVTECSPDSEGGHCNCAVQIVTPSQASPPSMRPPTVSAINTRMLTKVGLVLLVAIGLALSHAPAAEKAQLTFAPHTASIKITPELKAAIEAIPPACDHCDGFGYLPRGASSFAPDCPCCVGGLVDLYSVQCPGGVCNLADRPARRAKTVYHAPRPPQTALRGCPCPASADCGAACDACEGGPPRASGAAERKIQPVRRGFRLLGRLRPRARCG